MDTAVLAGALDLPDYDQRRREYLACGWLPPKWDWVDPLKDARAEIEQIDAGLKSRTQALAERGYDAEQVDAEIAADKAREKSLGLSFVSKPAGDACDASQASYHRLGLQHSGVAGRSEQSLPSLGLIKCACWQAVQRTEINSFAPLRRA